MRLEQYLAEQLDDLLALEVVDSLLAGRWQQELH